MSIYYRTKSTFLAVLGIIVIIMLNLFNNNAFAAQPAPIVSLPSVISLPSMSYSSDPEQSLLLQTPSEEQNVFQEKQITSIVDSYLENLRANKGLFDSLPVSLRDNKANHYSLREYLILSSAHDGDDFFQAAAGAYTKQGRFIAQNREADDIITLIQDVLGCFKNKQISYNSSNNILNIKVAIEFEKKIYVYINKKPMKLRNNRLVLILTKNLTKKHKDNAASACPGCENLSLNDIYLEPELIPNDIFIPELMPKDAFIDPNLPARASSMIFLDTIYSEQRNDKQCDDKQCADKQCTDKQCDDKQCTDSDDQDSESLSRSQYDTTYDTTADSGDYY